ncbi:acetate--CoA ligase family protein [Rhodococcus opacus]|uniref:acetate--CoA ligase family protein n=1 Tax=Rhodococcus opacus TaxID=37919 RepID=UPI00155A13B2|nr:acetate--CoA ligase family protein [Rhodococcus opacus]
MMNNTEQTGAAVLQQNPLDALFAPKSIVLVGASADRTKIGGRLLAHLLRYGYAGRLHLVNRSEATVQGLDAVPSIEELPTDAEVDLGLVAVPAAHVPAAVRSLATAGVRAAVIVSSGFSETGAAGKALEDEIREIAAVSGMRILGPNCQGVANVDCGLAASFSSVFGTIEGVSDGPTAVVSQSGAMAAVLTQLSLGRSNGVRYWAATGNESDLVVADLVAHVVTDPAVRVVQIYLENIASAKVLAEVARLARDRGTTLLVLKSGVTADGAKAASSHTGALAQEDAVIGAFLARHGLVRAQNLREMSELAAVFASPKRPAGNRVAMITNSGGLGVMLADGAAHNKLALAEFSAQTTAALRESLPAFAAVSNPIDVTAQLLSRPELIREAIRAVEADPGVDVIVIALGILGSYYDLDQILSDVVELDRRTDKVVVVCWVAGDPGMPTRFAAAGLPTFDDTTSVMNAVGALVAHTEFVRGASADADTAVSTPRGAVALPSAAAGALSEYTGKQLLRSWGLSVVDSRLAASADQAVAAAESVGYPVVLKLSAQGLAHKTELGLVEVGVADEHALQAAAVRMLAATGPDGPVRGEVDGLLVEPLIGGGLEMNVGVLHDHTVGNVVMVGAGGTAAELLADVALLIPPLTPAAVHEALRGLRIYPQLKGYRGESAHDVDSFVDFVLTLSNSDSVTAECVESLDVNPVLVMPAGHGSVAVDVALTPRTPG